MFSGATVVHESDELSPLAFARGDHTNGFAACGSHGIRQQKDLPDPSILLGLGRLRSLRIALPSFLSLLTDGNIYANSMTFKRDKYEG